MTSEQGTQLLVRSDRRAPRIVESKVHPPRLPEDTILRPRLIQLLTRSVERPVTLVVGAPGAGKTVLLATWQKRARKGMTSSWLSLDVADASPPRFWSHFLEALRLSGAVPPRSRLHALAPPPHGETASFVDAVATGLSELSTPLVLILDDVTEVTEKSVIEGLGLLIRYGPPQLRLVLAGRRDPPLSIARLRVSGTLSEVRAADLAFTLEETAQLVDRAGLSLSNQDVEALWRRTEGWVAALRLAILSLRPSDDPQGQVRAFAGSDRTVADYLVAEVLEQLPDPLRDFLLRTSIVDELDASLATTLTGLPNAAKILDDLERWSGFVVRLGSPPTSYRYHRLLVDLLRLEARTRIANELRELHRRAAHWYAAAGEVSNGIVHGTKAGDWLLVAQLLADEWFTLFLEGETTRLRRYFEAIPSRVVANDPELAIAMSGHRLTLGDVDGATAYLRLAEANESLVPPERKARFAEAITIVMLQRARLTGDHDQAILASREVLATSPRMLMAIAGRDEDRRALALSHVGTAEMWSGDFDSASGHLEDGLSIARRCGRDLVALDCMSSLALLKAIRGHLHDADDMASSAIDLARRRGWERVSQVAAAHLALALVRYHWNVIPEAGAELDAAQLAVESGSEPPMRMGTTLVRAVVVAAQGEIGEARALVRTTLLGMSDWRPPAFMEVALTLLHAKLCAIDNDADAARALLRSLAGLNPQPAEIAVEEARLALAEGNPLAAIEFLDRELSSGREDVHPGTIIEAWILDAVARERRGEHDAGRRSLRKALEAAEGEGFWRVFSENGAPVRELLRQEVRIGTLHRAFISDLLDSFDATPEAARISSRVLIEPLSERERAILRYLPSMLTNHEIAGETHVSVNTVKTHVKNIYRKLEARDRKEAVKRARRLHLL